MMSVHVTAEHIEAAEKLVAETKECRSGLAEVSFGFWEKNDEALSDSWNCAQMPLGIGMSDECMFGELPIEHDWYRMRHDHEWRVESARRYNDLAEEVVGRRLLGEHIPDSTTAMSPVKQLHDIFEAENVWKRESYWLERSASSVDELQALLDRVEGRLANLRDFLLPDNWEEGKAKALAAGGKVQLYRGQRGPVTFAMSVYGVEELIYLIMDKPDLAKRFSDLILRAMLERARILDEEAGFMPEDAPRGFYWCDDNCAMLNADMYELFGYPVLKGIFERYSPGPGDMRGQHSDSDMGQLLPLLGKLDMTTVNLGPNLRVDEIRHHLPNAVIHGQLAPFTFSRNEEVNMVAELIRDVEQAREAKGVVFATAGSINYGSRLSGLRLLMAAIERFGQFD